MESHTAKLDHEAEAIQDEPDRPQTSVQYLFIPISLDLPHDKQCSARLENPFELVRDPYSGLVECQPSDCETDSDITCWVQEYVSWCCDICGIEGRRRFVYRCTNCSVDFCVKCSLSLSLVRQPNGGRCVPWLDLLSTPGAFDSEPERLEEEAQMKKS